MEPRQGNDGVPHVTYFDFPTQLSFVWDGKSEQIEVSHGGYGEPVSDKIQLFPLTLNIPDTPAGWMARFQAACEAYIKIKEQ
jgi:hypothetical protein